MISKAAQRRTRLECKCEPRGPKGMVQLHSQTRTVSGLSIALAANKKHLEVVFKDYRNIDPKMNKEDISRLCHTHSRRT